MSRRKFLGLSGLGIGAGVAVLTAADLALMRYLDQFDRANADFQFLEHVRPPRHPLPPRLAGNLINSPFLWWRRKPEYIRYVLWAASTLKANNIRIFLNDKYEQRVGHHRKQPLAQIRALAAIVAEYNASHGTHIGLTVALYDCYTLLHSDKRNPDYGSSRLSSPYFKSAPGYTKTEKQLAFFTDTIIRGKFSERITSIVKTLRDIPEITAWEVANEPEIPGNLKSDDARDKLTQWYTGMIAAIRGLDPDRPVITGLAKPSLIDESAFMGMNIVNSFHIYPGIDTTSLRSINEHVQSALLPLGGYEIGVGKTSGGPAALPAFAAGVVRATVADNVLGAGAFGFWKIDAYVDNHWLNPFDPTLQQIFPRLAEHVERLNLMAYAGFKEKAVEKEPFELQ